MSEPETSDVPRRRLRALAKLALVSAAVAAAVGLVFWVIKTPFVQEAQVQFTLAEIIGLVVAINIGMFLAGAALVASYHWILRDWRGADED